MNVLKFFSGFIVNMFLLGIGLFLFNYSSMAYLGHPVLSAIILILIDIFESLIIAMMALDDKESEVFKILLSIGIDIIFLILITIILTIVTFIISILPAVGQAAAFVIIMIVVILMNSIWIWII